MEWIECGRTARRNAAPKGHWKRLRGRLEKMTDGAAVTALFACPTSGPFLLAGPLRVSAVVGDRLIGLQPIVTASGRPASTLLDFALGSDVTALAQSRGKVCALEVAASAFVVARFDSFGDEVSVAGFTVQGHGDQLSVGRHVVRTGDRPGGSLMALRVGEPPRALRELPRDLKPWVSTPYPDIGA